MVPMLTSLKSWFISQPSDDHLADYAKSGDTRHLTKLVTLFGNDLYHYLVTQSNEQLAFDISQQTWLKVMEKRHHYQPQANPKAWLFRLARNALIDEYRKQQRFVELEDSTVIAQLPIAAADSQIRTQRRSYLSASQPMGYCAMAPPKTKAARNHAIWSVSSPTCVP